MPARHIRKRPVTSFGHAAELGEVLEIIPEISPELAAELSDYGADGDNFGERSSTSLVG